MKTLSFILSFFIFSFVFCESELEGHAFEGDDFKYSFDFEGGDKAIGVKRQVVGYGGEDQFYYFCEKSKGENKKKCGAWVDKKGNKIKGATNKVTLKGKQAIIAKITQEDRGRYTSIFEDPKQEVANVRLYVGTRPPPPPKAYEQEGADFKYSFNFEDAYKAIGVKRILLNEYPKAQFFYFCDKAKGAIKKKCGAWVDEKGNKIKNANNRVSFNGNEAVIKKVVLNDSGTYFGAFEDPTKDIGRLPFFVSQRPPPRFL